MTYSTIITSKGQITLPAAFRRALGIRTGNRIEVTRRGDTIIMKAPVDFLEIRAANQAYLRKITLSKQTIEAQKIDELRQKYGL